MKHFIIITCGILKMKKIMIIIWIISILIYIYGGLGYMAMTIYGGWVGLID